MHRATFQPIKALDIELGQPFTDIEAPGYGSLHALIRGRGTPLGYVVLPLAGGRCAGGAVRDAVVRELGPAIAWHVAELTGMPQCPSDPAAAIDQLRRLPGAAPLPGGPAVSVAVCTRDRPADVEACLAALCRIEYPLLEILVVDNAPRTNATESLVQRCGGRVRYVREPRPGLSWARNRAIAEARGEILAFTDDDVTVDARWVESFVRVFVEEPEAMAVTGLVAPGTFETRAQLWFEAYGGFGGGFERLRHRIDASRGERVASRYGWSGIAGTGANMAFRRSVFETIGGFDPAMGPGTPTRSGDDLDMFFRIVKAGHLLVYEPGVLVRHRHRRSYAEVRSQLTAWGVATCSYAVRSAWQHRDERGPFARACGRWTWSRLRTLAGLLRRPASYPRRLLLAELSGVVIGVPMYPLSRRMAARMARAADPPRECIPASPENGLTGSPPTVRAPAERVSSRSPK